MMLLIGFLRLVLSFLGSIINKECLTLEEDPVSLGSRSQFPNCEFEHESRHISRESTSYSSSTEHELRVVLCKTAQVRDIVSDKLDFPIGYYHKSEKAWINNEHDVQDAIQLMKELGKATLWCVGHDQTFITTAKKRDQNVAGEDLLRDTSGPPNKKRKVPVRSELVVRMSYLCGEQNSCPSQQQNGC